MRTCLQVWLAVAVHNRDTLTVGDVAKLAVAKDATSQRLLLQKIESCWQANSVAIEPFFLLVPTG